MRHLLTYNWSLTSRPAGSTATLTSATSAKPTFTADGAGTYVASLTVNDGKVGSSTSTVTVTAEYANVAPVANAGPPQTVSPGLAMTPSLVRIDGSGSSDANGDRLTYLWSMTSKPNGSTAAIANPTGGVTTFMNDGAGTYVATLVVNDGILSSAPSTVTITAQVTPQPIANAGPDQDVAALSRVTLDGSGSIDPTGARLTSYQWTIGGPLGSTATISNGNQAIASFTPDIVGIYSIGLQVGASRGGGTSFVYSTMKVTAR
jgi:chitinase